jgi:predicted dehydrogenase
MKDVLIIGAGSIGHRHLRCFLATGQVRAALCDVNRALADEIAAQYGVERVYSTLDEALVSRFDAAVVAAPAHLHVAMATRLAEAGVHLLIEKPLSTTLDGIDELSRTVRDCAVVAAVAYVYHAHPVLQAMKQALDTGRFGRPVQVVATCGQHFPTYRPAYRDIYYRDRATGGGAIQDALTHVVNASEWLVGPVDRVLADAAHQVLDGVDVEDTVHLLTRHGDPTGKWDRHRTSCSEPVPFSGHRTSCSEPVPSSDRTSGVEPVPLSVLGCYSLNQHQAPNELTITVICDRGTVRFEAHHQRWRWMVQPDEPWHDEPGGEIPRDSLFVSQAQAFLAALDGAPPLCTLEEGIQTLRVNLAALESLRQRAWQELPPR